MRNSTVLLAALLAFPLGTQAATLKPFSTLTGSIVRLSDIWTGVTADQPLGPGPAPGGRITVPAPQLAAIARDYGVDWHPSSSGERAVLERPGRTLTRDDIKPALWTALLGAGASADSELEIGAFTAALVPTETKLDVTVEQIDVEQQSGRFSALLNVAADETTTTQLRITGRVQQMIDVPVLRHRAVIGDVIAEDDLEWAHLRIGLVRGDVIHNLADVVGLAAKRPLTPNQPILTADVGRQIVVQKGDVMILHLNQPGIDLTARAIAVQPGGVGDHIRALNEAAQMTVEVEITGPDQARVVPGTARPANRFVAAR